MRRPFGKSTDGDSAPLGPGGASNREMRAVPPRGPKPKLLLVLPDRGLAMSVEKFMVDSGIDVDTASDGLTCATVLTEWSPTVVVLDADVCRNRIGGLIARLLKSRRESAPLVFLVGDRGQAMAREFRDLSIAGCLSQPRQAVDLFRSLDRAVSPSGFAGGL